MQSTKHLFSAIGAATLFAAISAQAAVPPDIEAKLIEMGPGVCVAATGKLYTPLQPTPPYPGVKSEHDIPYADDPNTRLDVFWPEKGGGSRPVLVYVAGGAGNKTEPYEETKPFYDNMMLWAIKNGMVGVKIQRRQSPGWDGPAKDISTVVQWVQKNISKYKGNPDRVFMWAHSAGNPPVATYVGHPELYGPGGVGLKGVIFMSPANFNIAPATIPPTPTGGPAVNQELCSAGMQPVGAGRGGPGAAKGGPGGAKGGPGGGGVAKGGPGAPGGGGAAKGGGGFGRGQDPAQSDLPGLINAKVSYFIAYGDLDPANIITFTKAVEDELCKGKHCATTAEYKDHSHVSEVFAPNTKDDEVTKPILKWMKSVK